MKKCISWILILVCVLGLVGCDQANPSNMEPDFTEKPVVIGNSHSDVSGVFIQIGGIYTYPDKTTLVVSWNNETDHTVTYGEAYRIERLENGEWVDCSLKDNVFDAIAYQLQANQSDNKSYTLSDAYDISASGTYRILCACRVDMGDGTETGCSLWAEFIIA